MGWIEDGEILVQAPLVRMIQQFYSHIGIRFDEAGSLLGSPASVWSQ